MSDTESTQLWNDEDEDMQGGQAFSDALASLGNHLQEQGVEDETQAAAEMYDEGVHYESPIDADGDPAEVSYSDLTEEDAFNMDHGSQPEQDAGLSLDDELDSLIPDEPVAMSTGGMDSGGMTAGDTELSLDDELDNLIPDDAGDLALGDMELPLDDELEDDFGTPMHIEEAPGEMSLGAELDAILNLDEEAAPAEASYDIEPADEAYAETAPEDEEAVEEAGFDLGESDDAAAEAPLYSDDSYAEASYAEESYEAPAADDEGYLVEEEPAAADFAAYPSYEEAEEEMDTAYEAPAAAEEEAPEPVAHQESPMAALVGGHDSADDFNLATLTQLVDEIRQESDRVAEMKESVARALALIQEMSESLKS